MKKDILFLCQFFYPEHNSSATLPFDTAKAMVDKGLTVDALCGYPKEYTDSTKVPKRETKDGVGIRRLRYLQLKRSSFLGRLVNYLSFTVSVFFHIFLLRKYRAVIVYSNPPILPIVAVMAKKLFKTKIVFVSYDVYPEVAYASKTLKPGGVIAKAMKWVNKSLFKRVDMVVALTDEMREYLLATRKALTPDRITTIANWAHEEKEGAPQSGAKAGQEALTVAYFGNMGICQDVDTLAQAMDALKTEDKIRFILAGHGCKQEALYSGIQENPQVEAYNFLTGEDFNRALAATSVGIVSLEPGLKGLCAPSKYYSYLACGIPVAFIGEPDSYLAREVEQAQIGFAVANGDSEAMEARLRELLRSEAVLQAMANNALALYQSQYARSLAMARYYEMFTRLLAVLGKE